MRGWIKLKDKDFKLIITHLEYIKQRVDSNHSHLKELNGRVRKNEVAISWIRGIGMTFAFIVSSIIGFFMKE